MLTRQEVADELGLSVSTVQRMYLAGQIGYRRVGRQVRIPRSALWRYMDGLPAEQVPTPALAPDDSTFPETPSLLGELK